MRWFPKTITILLCLTSNLLAQEYPALREGNWWRAAPARERNAYVLGMLDGMAAGLIGARKHINDEQYHQIGLRVAQLMYGTQPAELANGLSNFYAEAKNRQVPICAALWVIALQVRGDASPAQIDADIKRLRAASAEAIR